MFHQRKTCRLCDGIHLEHIMYLADTPVGDDYIPVTEMGNRPIQPTCPLDLYSCGTCGLIQVTGTIDSDRIYSEYLYETSVSLGLVRHFEEYAYRVLEDNVCEKGSLVVDIGSNDGSLLGFFKKTGYRVLGVEPASKLAEKATANGVETWTDYFSAGLARKIRQSKGPASIITANNVFANIDHLNDFVEGIKILLDKDGVFIIETGYAVDTIQNCVLDNIYHEHLCYFTLKPLCEFFHGHGFAVIDVERTHTKGGSIRVTAKIKGGPRRPRHSVHELLALEKELGFDRMAPFGPFVRKAEQTRQELGNMLSDLTRNGKIIGGYGASVGVTTLLYYFGLGAMVRFLFDDNPIKQGTLSPGYHIPVHDSSEIYRLKPDYIVMFSWRYAGPIIKKHKAYLADHGHFILPFPSVEII